MIFGALPRRQEVLDPEWFTPSEKQARAYLEVAKSSNTLRAYRADWADFSRWCAAHNREPLPASTETVILYLTGLSNTAKVTTLARRLSAIGRAHQIADCDSPTRTAVVRDVLAGIRRTRGSETAAKKALLVEDLKRIVAQLPDSMIGLRDRALLLLGFTGAFRRSELVAIDCEDIRTTDHGLTVTIGGSKADAETRGRTVGIPFGSAQEGTCPANAVERWRRTAGIDEGALFRVVTRHGRVLDKRLSGEAVGLVVKHRVDVLGLDPARFGGHSLRAGLATSAAMAGKSERAIMRQTGHRSVTAVRRYIREGGLFQENAAEGLGL